jgi:hypothetical protein
VLDEPDDFHASALADELFVEEHDALARPAHGL